MRWRLCSISLRLFSLDSSNLVRSLLHLNGKATNQLLTRGQLLEAWALWAAQYSIETNDVSWVNSECPQPDLLLCASDSFDPAPKVRDGWPPIGRQHLLRHALSSSAALTWCDGEVFHSLRRRRYMWLELHWSQRVQLATPHLNRHGPGLSAAYTWPAHLLARYIIACWISTPRHPRHHTSRNRVRLYSCPATQWRMASSSTHKDDLLNMMIWMGMSGSRKSFFIDALKQGSAQIGNNLYSCAFLRGYSIFI